MKFGPKFWNFFESKSENLIGLIRAEDFSFSPQTFREILSALYRQARIRLPAGIPFPETFVVGKLQLGDIKGAALADIRSQGGDLLT